MIGKRICMALALMMALAMMPQTSLAAVGYLPDVTGEMSKASYWSDKMDAPDETLVEESDIRAINKAIEDGTGTGVFDPSTYSQTTFNGQTTAESLYNSALADCRDYFYYGCGAMYDGYGNGYATWDAAWESMYKAMVENCVDDEATAEMPVQFAICTKRTNILSLPSNERILDDRNDPDFDYQYQSALRLGEPVILTARSKDHKYYMAKTSFTNGWISVDDIAICESRQEWLEAWKFSSDKTLVVYDDKVFTEDSNSTPETANIKLTMGTCLKLADKSEWEGLISNRSADNNHVVWIPVRNEEGKYEKRLALVAEHLKVSEGFLPLTHANVAMVALNWLGNCYGWGGMLGSEDCSGYVRDVYKCFGLELARNTNGQANQPVKKFGLEGLSDNEKAEIIKKMPVGSVLIFNGHEMIYLGCEGDKLYVISAVSKMKVNGEIRRIRNTVINTLDVCRENDHTWLASLTTAEIPYRDPSYVIPEKHSADPAVPGKPVISAAANLGNMTVTMKWKPVKNANRYRAEYRKAGASKWTAAGTSAASYVFKGLYVRGCYQFRARALNTEEGVTKEGAYSSTKNLYMKAAAFKVKKLKKKVRVTWKKDAKASGYQVRYSLHKNMKNAKTVTVRGAKKTSLKIGGLKKGKRYYIQVRPYKTYKGVKYTGVYKAKKSVKR